MRKLLTTAVPMLAVIGLAVTSASAASLSLTDPAPESEQYQQTQNSPCVIGESSCKNPDSAWDALMGQIPSNTTPYDVTSGAFTVSQIKTAINGSAFVIGIDVNTTTHPLATEHLDLFTVTITGLFNGSQTTTTYSYDPSSPGTQLHTVNNGNGYADSILGSVDLTGWANTATVVFHTIVNSATDGREEFFLVNTSSPPPVIPEPATLGLLGTGLFGVARAVRRRRNATLA